MDVPLPFIAIIISIVTGMISLAIGLAMSTPEYSVPPLPENSVPVIPEHYAPPVPE